MTKGVGKKATIQAKMRRKRAHLGEVTRDGRGNVTMIRFMDYKDNPLAPEALVSKVGGIFRVNTHLIRVTFVDEVPNAAGEVQAVAKGHLVWKTGQDWLATREVFEYAMMQFRRGALREDEENSTRQ